MLKVDTQVAYMYLYINMDTGISTLPAFAFQRRNVYLIPVKKQLYHLFDTSLNTAVTTRRIKIHLIHSAQSFYDCLTLKNLTAIFMTNMNGKICF